tara:strand:+ start:698 stop:1006 length:309 start_codon:yes stop_codon:yes gene_type:complete
MIIRTEDPDEAGRILPAWFVSRMMTDEWQFAFVLSDGTQLALTRIDWVVRDSTGRIWLDVRLMAPRYRESHTGWNLTYAPTARVRSSVSVDHIMYAIEIGDT